MKSDVKKILVASARLDKLGGSETFTYTLIEELNRRDYILVEYFTFEKGLVSDKIEKRLGVSFKSLKKYDLILANHNTCVNALYKFGYIIQTCHGIFPRLEQPSPVANAYVSISTEVQNHIGRLGYPSILIPNSINLNRFKSINAINAKLSTVLSLCHSEDANKFVEKACVDLGVNFIKAFKYEDAVWNMEKKINQADLVVGLGRSAYEAMACGRPVVVYDNRSYFESCGDGYIRHNLGFSFQNNCSGRYTKKHYSLNSFKEELQKYNCHDGNYFRCFAEKELNVRNNIDSYLKYWQDCIKQIPNMRKRRIKRFIEELIGIKNSKRVINFIRKIE